MSSCLDPDQDRSVIGRDLDANYLQRLSPDIKVATSRQSIKCIEHVMSFLTDLYLFCILSDLRRDINSVDGALIR